MSTRPFHLRALATDLTSAEAEAARVSALLAESPVDAEALRRAAEALASTIEHAVGYHARLSLRRGRAGDPIIRARAPTYRETSDGPTLRAAITKHLDVVVSTLNEAAPLLSSLVTECADPVIAARLSTLLRSGLVPSAKGLLSASSAFHRKLDPLAALAEDHDQEVALAAAVLTATDARTLSVCPRCGAALSALDRTRSGSYCEVCRTRWVEPDR